MKLWFAIVVTLMMAPSLAYSQSDVTRQRMELQECVLVHAVRMEAHHENLLDLATLVVRSMCTKLAEEHLTLIGEFNAERREGYYQSLERDVGELLFLTRAERFGINFE